MIQREPPLGDESETISQPRMSAKDGDINNGEGNNNNEADDNEHDHPRQKHWGEGIRNDFRRTIASHWGQEMIPRHPSKLLGVSFFLFIAVIAPSITFGAVYAKRTNNTMGAVELLIATAWCGIFYSLTSGMPMMINGGTGPVLTFQALIYELSKTFDVPFLTLNAWVGLWVALYMFISAVIDLNRYIQYATRFTDEVFAFLIISIFILDAIGNPVSQVGLMHYFNPDHQHHEEEEEVDADYEFLNVAFLSMLLGFGTCFFAIILRQIRHSPFCCNDAVRSIVTDFSITLSVVLFTIIKEFLFPEVNTEQLNVPDTFAPTFECCTSECTSYFPGDCPDQDTSAGRRPWVVSLFDLNGKAWIIALAAGPAALAFILAFLDNGITWHIINHPSNKLSHGESYNYDTCVSAFMIAVNSMLGLPWLVASTVPCMMHVSAMSEISSNGTVVSVQESRLTGLLTHVMVLASLAALGAIKLIPLPVLYGVFLFMGLVALPAQQFWQRILLFFMQPNRYPTTPYTKYMKHKRIHLYTIIQMVFFGLLYTVKTIKTIAIAFPFFILLCIPTRMYLLPRIFEAYELILLDGSPEQVTRWVDQKELDDRCEETEEGQGSSSNNTSSGGNNKDQDESSEEEDDGGDQMGLLWVTSGMVKPHRDMYDAATRRSGRLGRRQKTVSDISGLFQKAPAIPID